jgi:hypothetical protein
MIFRDSLNAPYRPIGTVWVQSGRARREFETASWYELIAYTGQTVIVYSNGYYVKWTVRGYVVDSQFGGGKLTAIGTTRSYTFSTYTHMWAEKIANGDWINKGYEFDLLAEYGVGCAPYVHDPSKIGYFISMPASGHPLLVERRPNPIHMDRHTYRVSWRGERRPSVIVERKDGFNGDTWNVAMQRASEALDLIETHNRR